MAEVSCHTCMMPRYLQVAMIAKAFKRRYLESASCLCKLFIHTCRQGNFEILHCLPTQIKIFIVSTPPRWQQLVTYSRLAVKRSYKHLQHDWRVKRGTITGIQFDLPAHIYYLGGLNFKLGYCPSGRCLRTRPLDADMPAPRVLYVRNDLA